MIIHFFRWFFFFFLDCTLFHRRFYFVKHQPSPSSFNGTCALLLSTVWVSTNGHILFTDLNHNILFGFYYWWVWGTIFHFYSENNNNFFLSCTSIWFEWTIYENISPFVSIVKKLFYCSSVCENSRWTEQSSRKFHMFLLYGCILKWHCIAPIVVGIGFRFLK